jgi:glycosyltransferase involved in cell wall biosynthesis
MKFSVLLPTRNRLDLLRLAIESVRLQDYSEWEIVVSDNASADDVCAYVASLRDPRILCHRTECLLPVTDNWNAALDRSMGDYLIMLGDDDGLMQGCLARANALVEEWNRPDAIYTEACQYTYPGVISGHPDGFIQFGYNAFLQGATGPFRLPRETALEMVRAAASFRIRYGYNMQHFIFSRKLVERLRPKGPFFQSPYPDYYAANAILLSAESIVANPTPLVMIGISPKSFGYYYYNKRESEGVAFLQNLASGETRDRLQDILVPGSNMNDSWLFAMEKLAQNFCNETPLQVDYARYRLLQFNACLRTKSWRGIASVLWHARAGEIVHYGALVARYAAAYLLPPSRRRQIHEAIRASMSAFPRFDLRRRAVPQRDLLEAIRHYEG